MKNSIKTNVSEVNGIFVLRENKLFLLSYWYKLGGIKLKSTDWHLSNWMQASLYCSPLTRNLVTCAPCGFSDFSCLFGLLELFVLYKLSDKVKYFSCRWKICRLPPNAGNTVSEVFSAPACLWISLGGFAFCHLWAGSVILCFCPSLCGELKAHLLCRRCTGSEIPFRVQGSVPAPVLSWSLCACGVAKVWAREEKPLLHGPPGSLFHKHYSWSGEKCWEEPHTHQYAFRELEMPVCLR